MTVSEVSIFCQQLNSLTQLKAKISFVGKLPNILKKERKLPDLPEHKYNKNDLNFCFMSDTELDILNEFSSNFSLSSREMLLLISFFCRCEN